MTSIKAQHKEISNERLKNYLQRLVLALIIILDPQSAQSEEFAEAHELNTEESYDKFCQLWNRLFLDIDCWNVEIINDDDSFWQTFYKDFRILLKYAHFLSHKK
jgi:hypothetical protein